MNRPDERAPRARREVPTLAEFVGFLLALMAIGLVVEAFQ